MTTCTFDRDRYLARLGLTALPAPTAAGLRELVRAQLRAVAFENLDVLAGRPISVAPADIVAKILGRGRGGYCFELNGLLGLALTAAGFQATVRLARVSFGQPAPGSLSHQVFLVACEGTTWLVDVGFGGPGLAEPVPFVPGTEFVQDGARFRLSAATEVGVQLERLIGGAWAGIYVVSPLAVLPVDIEVGSHFVSTWERSIFRATFKCARPVADGLAVIKGTDLVVLDAEMEPVSQRPLGGAGDLAAVMREVFGVQVEPEIASAAWETVAAARSGRAGA